MLLVIGVLLICAPLAAAQVDPEYQIPKENPHRTPADLERGQKLFMGHCASCHGPKGEGGRGPSLARPKLTRAPDDPALFRLISEGIPGTEMPGAWVMISREIWQVSAFVRTLGQVAEERITGDLARGKSLYRTKGNCGHCHTVAGQGGSLGPELTGIGARRSASYLRTSLLDPQEAVPRGFLQVRAVTHDGRRITGIRLNEDTYTIQLRDLFERLLSLRKQDLKELLKDWGKSPMPSFRGMLSDSEIEDLVAYLVSLRGGS